MTSLTIEEKLALCEERKRRIKLKIEHVENETQKFYNQFQTAWKIEDFTTKFVFSYGSCLVFMGSCMILAATKQPIHITLGVPTLVAGGAVAASEFAYHITGPKAKDWQRKEDLEYWMIKCQKEKEVYDVIEQYLKYGTSAIQKTMKERISQGMEPVPDYLSLKEGLQLGTCFEDILEEMQSQVPDVEEEMKEECLQETKYLGQKISTSNLSLTELNGIKKYMKKYVSNDVSRLS